jgi:GT2 family glycosyltransferase
MTTRPKIVLLGMLTRMPVGGVAWLVGQYVIGFERLGYDVYYVEAHARTPSMFIDHPDDDGTDRAAAYLAGVMRRFGLDGRWALHALHADGRCVGMTAAEVSRLYRDAALIVNMHGGTVPLPEHTATGRLVLLSTDPVELELELAREEARAVEFVGAHVASFTWGLNYGNPDCALPWAAKYGFVPSAPPVVLDQWTTGAAAPSAPFTTIGNWRQAWREVTFEGQRYGWSKHHEFMKIVDLPRKVTGELQLALSSATDGDRAMLRQHGWSIEDGLAVSSDMDDYRSYLHSSRGEFTVAKEQNVRFRSGWFSERSACYLASGRPVVMQDTGFGNALPVGAGLLPFVDLDSAAAAVEDVLADEARHRRGALDVAAGYLSYDVVLRDMLRRLGLPAPAASVRCGSALAPPAPAALPEELLLVPVSRRPLVLPPDTEQRVLARPVPSVTVDDGHPTASVLVVVHDNLAVTRMALESVLANTDGRYEIVVVDNGSQPATRRYLSVLSARNPHVRLIVNDSNRGFAPAVNQALSVARGDVLALINNDVIVAPGWLDGLAARLADPAIGLVGPVTNRCGNEAEITVPYETYGELLTFVGERHGTDRRSFDIPVAIMFCVAMRRETLHTVGLLDERYEVGMFEDDDYSRRVRDAGLRVVCTPEVFVHHFGEASIGRLAADGTYGAVFDANRRRYEQKWGERWLGHDRCPDPQYAAMVARVRAAIDEVVPDGCLALVVSHGDEQMVPPTDRRVRHFPSTDGGEYRGHHPADDADAIEQLEALRANGATHLVIPASSGWWLTYYQGFAHHLTHHYQPLIHEPETAVIFAIEPTRRPGAAAEEREPHAPFVADDAGGSSGGPDGATGDAQRQLAALVAERDALRRQLRAAEQASVGAMLSQITSRLDNMEDLLDEVLHPEISAAPAADGHLLQQSRELVRRHVPRGSSVLVATTDASPLFDVAGRPTSAFALACRHVPAGATAGACPCAVARLEALRAAGVDHLLVPATVGGVADRLADHLVGYPLTARGDGGLLFDVRARHLTPDGWPRALSACAARLATVLDDDIAILDWTELHLSGRIGPRNVFQVVGPSLPHLDASVPVVLIDDRERLTEAARVASAAVVVVADDVRPVVIEVHPLDRTVAEAAHQHDDRDPDPADVALVIEAGVVPLPGCIDAARAALAAPGVGAVAVKLYADDGSIGATGVTVFADGSWAAIARDAADPAAPWHEYRRDTCASAGLLVLRADVATAVTERRGDVGDLRDWSAAVWDAGLRVVYEPEAEAVHTAPTPETFCGSPSAAWAAVAPARPIRPAADLDDGFWRGLLATDDVAACWNRVEEVL